MDSQGGHTLGFFFYYDVLAIVTKTQNKNQWSENLGRWLEDAVSKLQTDAEFRAVLSVKPDHTTAILDQCFSIFPLNVQISDELWRALLSIASSLQFEVSETAKNLVIHYLHHTHRIKMDEQTLTLLSTITNMERAVKKMDVPLDLQHTQLGESIVVLKCLIDAISKARPLVVQVVAPDIVPVPSQTEHLGTFPTLRPSFPSGAPHTYPGSSHAFSHVPTHAPLSHAPSGPSGELHSSRGSSFGKSFTPASLPSSAVPRVVEPTIPRSNPEVRDMRADPREIPPREIPREIPRETTRELPPREIPPRVSEPITARVAEIPAPRPEPSRIPPQVPAQQPRPTPLTEPSVKMEQHRNGSSTPEASHRPTGSSAPTVSGSTTPAPIPTEPAEPEAPDWVTGYNPAVQKEIHVELLRTHEHDSVVCSTCFSQGGRYLATGCNGTAKIFDVMNGDEVKSLRVADEQEESIYVRSVQFSPDATCLATASEDAVVRLWDVTKGTVSHTLRGHQADAYSTAFSPDGYFLVSGSGDKTVKVWDVRRGNLLETLGNPETGPTDGVTCVAVSPDGLKIAAASLDRVVRLWDTQTGALVHSFTGHNDAVYSVAFSPDGKTLASGSLDRTVRTWDINSKSCAKTLTGHRDFVLTVAFLPDGEWLLSGSKDQSINFWNYKTGLVYVILRGHRNSVISLSSANNLLASASGDHRARVWHVSTVTANN